MGEEQDLDDVIEQETAPRHAHVAHVPKGNGLVERAWTAQDKLAKRWEGLGKGRIARVIRMARKPEPEEFRHSAIVVLVGIAIIGAMGFFTYLFMKWLLHAITPA